MSGIETGTKPREVVVFNESSSQTTGRHPWINLTLQEALRNPTALSRFRTSNLSRKETEMGYLPPSASRPFVSVVRFLKTGRRLFGSLLLLLTVLPGVSMGQSFIRGDVNGDGVVDPGDTADLLQYLAGATPAPFPIDRADVNDNEFVNMTDVLALTEFLFFNGPQPPLPFPGSGPDPSDSQRDFGAPNPDFLAQVSVVSSTPTEVIYGITASAPTPIDLFEATLELAPSLSNPVFAFSSTAAQGGSEFIGTQLALFVNPITLGTPILPTGSGTIGFITVDQDGSLADDTEALDAVRWIAEPMPFGAPRPNLMENLVDHYPQLIPRPEAFRRGDCNDDSSTNIADAVYLLLNLFPNDVDGDGSPDPVPLFCLDACDGNDDGSINLSDVIAILSSTFGAVPIPLPEPGSSCGEDPTTTDSLDCVDYFSC